MYIAITGTGDGTAPVVNLTFDYLNKSHVKASVNGVEVSYTWTGASQITFSAAVAVGAAWTVSRVTPADPLVDFTNGAVLVEGDLDTATRQALFRQDEINYHIDDATAQADASATAAAASAASIVGDAAAAAASAGAASASETAAATHASDAAATAASFAAQKGAANGIATLDASSHVPEAQVTFLQAGTGATARSVQTKLRDLMVSPKDFGALANGSDDAAALQAALNTGHPVYLQPGVTYSFGSQLTVPAGGGFVGGGKLIMLTGTGKFDAATYGSPRAYAGILLNAAHNAVVQAEITMEANAGIRVCTPIAVVSSTNVRLDIEAYGFKETQGGVVAWDSNVGGHVRLYAHDMTPNSTTLPTLQVTGLSVDDNRVSSTNSIGLRFEVRVANLRLGAAARAVYGEQTDGVNIRSQGYSGAIGTVSADTVGEALDLWGDNCEIRVAAKDAYYFGVKLMHGASGNKVTASIDGTGGSAVSLAGSDTSNKDTVGNDIQFTATRVGALVAAVPPSLSAAVIIQGIAMTYKPLRNVVRGTASGAAASGGSNGYGYAIYHDSDVGTDNISEVHSNGHQTAFTNLGRSSTNRSRRVKKSRVFAYRSSAASYNNNATIVYNTEVRDTLGEYNPATGVFTASNQGRYLVTGSWRNGGVPAGGLMGARIIVNGSADVRNEQVNMSASAAEMTARVSGVVELQAGDTVEIYAVTNGTAYAATAISEYSFLEVDEL